MLKQIAEDVLPHVNGFTMIVSGNKEALVVALITSKKENGVKVKPITIKGELAEVEKALPAALKEIFADNKELLTNASSVADAVKKDAAKIVKSKDKPKVATTATATEGADDAAEDDDNSKGSEATQPVTEVFKPNAKQKKAETEAKKAVDKARESKDHGMLNFLEKQHVAQYAVVEMPESKVLELKGLFGAIRKELPAEDEGTLFNKEKTEVVEPAKPAEKVATIAPAEKEAAPVTEEDENIIF